MIGNVTSGTEFHAAHADPARPGLTYFGRIGEHVQGCAWLATGNLNGHTGHPISDPGCARTGPGVKKFASFISSDYANHAKAVTLSAAHIANHESIWLYRNVRPYAAHPALHDRVVKFAWNRAGTQKPATIGWRYVTRDGNYVAISSSALGYPESPTHGDRYGFVRRSDLAAALCPGHSETGVRPKKPSHKDWPNVCTVNKPVKKKP